MLVARKEWVADFSALLPDPKAIKADLERLYASSYRSLAIILVHSYTFPHHELLIAALAKEVGFTHISVSSQLLPMIKMVPRGVSSTADAYLTPILYEYLDGFFSGFDERLRHGGGDGTARVEFMGSDGGLLDLDNFSGLKSILSGPAGGVVGYALTSWDGEEKTPIIGFVDLTCSTSSQVLIFLFVLGSTLAEPRRTSHATQVDTKSSTKRLLRG